MTLKGRKALQDELDHLKVYSQRLYVELQAYKHDFDKLLRKNMVISLWHLIRFRIAFRKYMKLKKIQEAE